MCERCNNPLDDEKNPDSQILKKQAYYVKTEWCSNCGYLLKRADEMCPRCGVSLCVDESFITTEKDIAQKARDAYFAGGVKYAIRTKH
jgi:RNA polymerase subunit RPABC4/transcription elongation factor Spt4